MKRNLFKTKVLVWLLLMVGLFGNYTYGQTPTVVEFTPTLAGGTWAMPAGVIEFDIEIWGKGADGQYGGGSGGGNGGGGGGYLKIAGLKDVALITFSEISSAAFGQGFTKIDLYDNTTNVIGVLKAFSPSTSSSGTGGGVDYPSGLVYSFLISANGGNGNSGLGTVGSGGKGGGDDGGAGGTPSSTNGVMPGGGGAGAPSFPMSVAGAGGAGLVRITYSLAPSITTTFNQVAPICKGATLVALPTTSTNMPTGITGTWSPAINNMATTTYTFTPTPGQDASTATMTIVVNAPTAPTATSPQSFCQGQKVEDLVATGIALKWYSASSGGSELAAIEVLTATTYYVSQTVDGCESDRTPVVVTFKAGPSVEANSITSTPTACNLGTINFTPNISTVNTVLIDETFNANNTNVCTIHGDAFYEILGQNFVKLTTNQNNKQGQLLFAKTSSAPKAFEFKFDAFMLNKDGADGFSVNYGEIGNVQSLQEDGNTTGLVLRFKNFGQDRIQVFYNGTQIGADINLTLEDGYWWTYTITVNEFNQISLKRKRLDGSGSEINIFSFLPISNYNTTSNYQWAFAARTGGSNNEHIIDAVKFTDKTPLQFSYDQNNWQTATTFTNVPAGFRTVYARVGNTGCPANVAGGSITVVGTTPPTPTFTPIAPICKGAITAPLPTTSTNGIAGTWSNGINNLATTTYTFTPSAGECASTATMTITVNEPITPTFNGNTVVLDKNYSSNPNSGIFTVTTPATYRIELWGKGGDSWVSPPNTIYSGKGGGYTAKETILNLGNYNYTFIVEDNEGGRTYFTNQGTNTTFIDLFAYNAGGGAYGDGGTKNISGGNGINGGGGAAGWWGHNGASLNGTATTGGDSGTPDNSSESFNKL